MYIYINLYLNVRSHLIERHVAPEDLHESIELEACDGIPGGQGQFPRPLQRLVTAEQPLVRLMDAPATKEGM
jgi:hypothetical protein